MSPACCGKSDCKCSRVTCSLLDVNAHNGELTGKSAGSEAQLVQALLELFFHHCSLGILVVRSYRAEESLLGKLGSNFRRTCDTYTEEYRRTSVYTIRCHLIEDDLNDSLVAFERHEYLSHTGEGASAACHVDIKLELIVIGYDLPVDPRYTYTYVVTCVDLIENLYCVVSCL